MPGFTLKGLLPDDLISKLDRYRAVNYLPRTAALRVLISTHPEIVALGASPKPQTKPGPKPKGPDYPIFGIPGSPIPGMPGAIYPPLEAQEQNARNVAARTGQPVEVMPDWLRAHRDVPRRPPVELKPVPVSVESIDDQAANIVRNLMQGYYEDGNDAFYDLERLEKLGVIERDICRPYRAQLDDILRPSSVVSPFGATDGNS